MSLADASWMVATYSPPWTVQTILSPACRAWHGALANRLCCTWWQAIRNHHNSVSTSARWRVHRLHHHFQGGWCYSEWLPNAIYSTGDTVYIDELAKIPEKFHVVCAVMSLGSAFADLPDGPLQITMDGKQAAHLFRTVKADYLVPMHYESWGHFTQFGKDLVKVFEEEGIMEKVRWLSPGTSVKVL